MLFSGPRLSRARGRLHTPSHPSSNQRETGKSMETLSVISPIGAEAVEQKNLAKRLDTLNGKVVAEVWNEDFKGDIMFPIYRELLKKRFPDVRIIPYTDIPRASLKGTPSYQRQVLNEIIAVLKDKGADAVITGNGG
ncbi:MAG: hypothetical protein QM644_20015 [Mobilitalea sp.]